MTSPKTCTIADLRPGADYPGGGINSRKQYMREEIEARKNSLVEFGQLQSLLVCPAPGKDKAPFYVAGGGLRFAAFGELIAEGKLKPDHAIDITVRPDFDSAMALAASIEENLQVLPTHPADVYEQFAALRERGRDEDAIAQLYGMKRKDVLRILALGNLHPEIRQAWREGKIKRELAEAYTIEPDRKRQLAVFKKMAKRNWVEARDVRKELVGEDSDCGALINFVGREAYEAAGGKVMIDLFQDQHGVSDPALAKRMADEKMEAARTEFAGKGWSWVAFPDELPHGWHHQWPTIDVKAKLEPDEAARLKVIAARATQISESDEYGDYSDSDQKELDQLEAEEHAIKTAAEIRTFTPAQMAKSGIVLSLNDNGTLKLHAGVIRPNAVKEVPDADLSSVDRKKKKKAVAGLSNALAQRLSETLTEATGVALAKQPEIALPALIGGFAANDPVRVTENGLATKKDHPFANGVGASRTKRGGFAGIFEAMLEAGPAQQSIALAGITASALDFQVHSSDRKPLADKNIAALIDALNGKAVNVALREAFDAEDYFSGIGSTMRVQAIKEACGEDNAARAAKLKKAEQVTFAVANVPKTGWLPPELRTSHYDGPAAAKAKAVAEKKTKKKAAKPPAKKKKKA